MFSRESVKLKCPSCHEVHQRIYRDDMGFGNCHKCGTKLIRQITQWQRRLNKINKELGNQ